MSGGKIEKKLSGGKTEVIGQWIKCTVQKNKTATPFRTCEFPVYFDGRKANIADELAEIAIENGLIPKFDANGKIVTNGGRVLGVTAKGATLKEARAKAYEATKWVNFANKYMRTDIGKAIDEA